MSVLVTVENLKLAYNYNLARFKKAEKYFSRCSEANVEKWIGEYTEIINNMGILIESLEKRNVKVTEENILNGFEINTKPK